MALLTTHSATNIVTFEPEATFSVFVAFEALAGVWYKVYNEYTTARYAYVGMTAAAAATCAAAIHDPDNGVNARVVRASVGGMFNVEVDKCVVVTTQTEL